MGTAKKIDQDQFFRRVCSVFWLVVVMQNRMCRAFEVVKLSVVDRPDKEPGNNGDQNQSQRNEQEQDIHYARVEGRGMREGGGEAALLWNLLRRSAFSTTSNELADMPMAAIQGVA